VPGGGAGQPHEYIEHSHLVFSIVERYFFLLSYTERLQVWESDGYQQEWSQNSVIRHYCCPLTRLEQSALWHCLCSEVSSTEMLNRVFSVHWKALLCNLSKTTLSNSVRMRETLTVTCVWAQRFQSRSWSISIQSVYVAMPALVLTTLS
jgi:hypothetical protein